MWILRTIFAAPNLGQFGQLCLWMIICLKYITIFLHYWKHVSLRSLSFYFQIFFGQKNATAPALKDLKDGEGGCHNNASAQFSINIKSLSWNFWDPVDVQCSTESHKYQDMMMPCPRQPCQWRFDGAVLGSVGRGKEPFAYCDLRSDCWGLLFRLLMVLCYIDFLMFFGSFFWGGDVWDAII